MSVQPISPDGEEISKQSVIPDQVIEAFNELISEKLSHGRRASFTLKEVSKRAEEKGVDLDEAFKKGWFDVEPLYQAQGWKVTCNSPGYNEFYETTFIFKK